MFGKLFADAIESVDAGPVESLAAIGSSRWQQIRYAVLPAAAPSIVAHWLYAYDINLRMAIALGVFGGGGIGFELFLSQKLLRHSDMLALVLIILVLITLTERLSDWLRQRLLR
jgi:phosphonate transport system permease protein